MRLYCSIIFEYSRQNRHLSPFSSSQVQYLCGQEQVEEIEFKESSEVNIYIIIALKVIKNKIYSTKFIT